MVRKVAGMQHHDLVYGDEVEIPWSAVSTVRGTVYDVYGHPDNLQVVVMVMPDESNHLVTEPTTFSLSIEKVTRIAPTPAA